MPIYSIRDIRLFAPFVIKSAPRDHEWQRMTRITRIWLPQNQSEFTEYSDYALRKGRRCDIAGHRCHTGGCDHGDTGCCHRIVPLRDRERDGEIEYRVSDRIPAVGGPDHNSLESITVRVNGLQVDDDADSGNTSAIAGVGTGYTLTISNNSNMTANNGKREPEWRQSRDHQWQRSRHCGSKVR